MGQEEEGPGGGGWSVIWWGRTVITARGEGLGDKDWLGKGEDDQQARVIMCIPEGRYKGSADESLGGEVGGKRGRREGKSEHT